MPQHASVAPRHPALLTAVLVMCCLGWGVRPSLTQAALVGFWAFDEDTGATTFVDSVGTANNGTCSTACPTVTTGRIGSHAWVWDGADAIVTVPAETEINQLAAVSVSVWLNPVSAGEGGAGTVVNKRGTGLNGWMLAYDDVAGRTRCLRWVVDWGGGVLNVRSANDALPAYGTGWYHVVLTWDGSLTATQVHLYVNGQEVTYQTQTDGIGVREPDTAEALLIGNGPSQAATMDGGIDHLRLFSHVLSPAEIASEYAAGASQRHRVQVIQAGRAPVQPRLQPAHRSP